MPKAITVSGHRCLILDIMSAGTGGSAWPEKHIFGTQLGPNWNGQKW